MKEEIMKEMFSLSGKTVLLTGAGGILAGEIARAVAYFGANTVVLDFSLDAAERTSSAITDEGGETMSLQCDVTNPNDLESCSKKIIERYGRIDCLVNGAGGNKVEATTSEDLSFFDIPLEMHQKVMDLNFIGTLLPSRVFGIAMAEQKKGSIVNIASISGIRPLTKAPAYAAGKAAVINFTQWLAVHFAQNYSPEIRVNAIAPGFFATQQNKYLLFDQLGNLTQRGKDILSQVPQKRFGNPSELVSTALWLLSESASFITGSVVTVDGGFDAFSGI